MATTPTKTKEELAKEVADGIKKASDDADKAKAALAAASLTFSKRQQTDAAKVTVNKKPGLDFFTQLNNVIQLSKGATEDITEYWYGGDAEPSANPHEDVNLSAKYLERVGDTASAFNLAQVITIQGVDISPYLTGDIKVEYNDVDGHHTYTFSVANDNDRFMWTEPNLRGIFGFSHPDFQRALDRSVKEDAQGNFGASAQDTENLRAMVTPTFTAAETIKREMYNYKANTDRNPITRTARNVPLFAKFDMAPFLPIFQRMDPVRIMSLYPFRTLGNEELWVPEAVGYVNFVSVQEDDTTGKSVITLECSCIRHSILEKMRISADATLGMLNNADDLGFRQKAVYNTADGNPPPAVAAAQSSETRFFTLNDLLKPTPGQRSSTQFYDELIFSIYNQLVPESPLEDAVRSLLVFQPEVLASGEGAGRGVRSIEFGGAFYFDPTRSVTECRAFLQEYHLFSLFGPKRRPWTRTEMMEVCKETTTDGKYNPSNIRLWMLLPSDGTGPQNLVNQSSISANASYGVSWTTRLEVIRKLARDMDYQFFTAPTGDLLLEFPMADFRPEDFGDFRNSFRFFNALQSTDFGQNQGDPPSAVEVVYSLAKGVSLNDNEPVSTLTRVMAVAPYIIARYGMRVEQIAVPQITDRNVAAQRAVIEFQKFMSATNALSFSTSFRPFMLPNRPVHHIKRLRMGTVKTVSKSFVLGKEAKASINLGLSYVRTFTGHYRSLDDIESLNDIQLTELKNSGIISSDTLSKANIDSIKGMDVFDNTVDAFELQVYTHCMVGESIPTSARTGWGKDVSAGILSAYSGIYLYPDAVNPSEDGNVNQAADETQQASVGVGLIDNPVNDQTPTNMLFTTRPLNSIVLISKRSRFGPRVHPVTGEPDKPHEGVDLDANSGDPVFAVDPGTIDAINPTNTGTGGISITLLADRFRVRYLHLSAIGKVGKRDLQVGDTVTAGQVIGLVGQTGRVTGPHLHLEAEERRGSAFLLKDPMLFIPDAQGPVTEQSTEPETGQSTEEGQ
jgi:murein DD-endopeptidase MepM/ murein hydrolase activator NlpD